MATITSISPTQGRMGTVVTLTGTAMGTTVSVNFGSAVVTPTSVTSTTVTFTVPSTAPCSGQVSVGVNASNGARSNAMPFFVVASPSTATSSPPCVTSTPGTDAQTVTVTGTGFAAGGTVNVGALTPVSFASGGSNTAVTVTPPDYSPAGSSESLPITVTTPGGTGTTGQTFVTYQNPPTLTSTVPTTAAAGESVTINGTNLENLISVTYDDGVNPAVPDPTAQAFGTFITSTVPEGLTPGLVTITVETCGSHVGTPVTTAMTVT